MNYVIVTRTTAPSASAPAPVSAPVPKPVPMPAPAPVPIHVPEQVSAPLSAPAPAPQKTCSTCSVTYDDDYGLGSIYTIYSPLYFISGLFADIYLVILFLGFTGIIVLASTIFLLLVKKRNECMCPKCRKIIKYKRKKPLRCQYCGARLEQIIRAN